MYKKILIANRGEIAVRIMRTCKKMDIKTVAVYSEADAESLHVKYADEAYLLGPPRVNESYLLIEKIIEIAKQTGAEAIHPGYGLLSENAKFAQECEKNGLVFIGPAAAVIEKMGNKIEARKSMLKANLPIVPGGNEPLIDEQEAVIKAREMKFPVMLKAAGGGGGIGMEIVYNEKQLLKAFVSNQARAKNFFGDGDMYLEKYLTNPRHIEIQILADHYGNVVYLWERECSIQRRNQKVLEEAPSPFLDSATRTKMGNAAVQAAKEIGYTNAGTMEFLVDEEKNFYFLEMNTRLQVEHPVTEEITGLDLVEQQLKISYGEPLLFKQEDISLNGHAIEVRICAEDPDTFFPSPGKITFYSAPNKENVRNETAVETNSIITPFYDSMIAKLIVKGSTRADAIKQLQEALEYYQIEGIKTNLPLLRKIVTHQAFIQGEITTSFIETYIQNATKMKE